MVRKEVILAFQILIVSLTVFFVISFIIWLDYEPWDEESKNKLA